MFDGGHVCGSVIGPRTHQIVMEDDIHDPVQAVFDVPVGANRGGKALGGRLCGREEVAPFARRFSVTLDLSLNPSYHGIEGVVRGHAFRKGQKAARKIKLPVTPAFDLNKILSPRHGRAQHNQKHFLQWGANLPRNGQANRSSSSEASSFRGLIANHTKLLNGAYRVQAIALRPERRHLDFLPGLHSGKLSFVSLDYCPPPINASNSASFKVGISRLCALAYLLPGFSPYTT